MENLTNPTLLDDLWEDWTIYKLNNLVWHSKLELWRKWTRS